MESRWTSWGCVGRVARHSNTRQGTLFLNIFQDYIYSLLATRCSPEWNCVTLINAHSVSHSSPLASWYQFHCLEIKKTRALVACPELLVRKSVDSDIELATLWSTGRNLNHTTTGPLLNTDSTAVSCMRTMSPHVQYINCVTVSWHPTSELFSIILSGLVVIIRSQLYLVNRVYYNSKITPLARCW